MAGLARGILGLCVRAMDVAAACRMETRGAVLCVYGDARVCRRRNRCPKRPGIALPAGDPPGATGRHDPHAGNTLALPICKRPVDDRTGRRALALDAFVEPR